MKNKKIKMNKQGISLIILVITIIVMIILATAVILSLSSSSVVEKANEATQRSNFANAKNIASIAYSECVLDGKTGDTEIDYVQSKLDESFDSGQYIAGENGKIVPIPVGFTASIYPGEDKISKGLVIYETTSLKSNNEPIQGEPDEYTDNQDYSQFNYNQFVWIPVNQKFERMSTFERLIGSYENYSEPYKDININELQEYNSMVDSVKTYGGFYIGRYQASSNTKRGATSGTTGINFKIGNYIYDYVAWGKTMTDTDSVIDNIGHGAVYLSRNAYSKNPSVVSTLCYGVQYDAARIFDKNIFWSMWKDEVYEWTMESYVENIGDLRNREK